MSDQAVVQFPSSIGGRKNEQETLNRYPVISGYLLQDDGLYKEVIRDSDGIKDYVRIAQNPVWVKTLAYFGPENAEQWLLILCIGNRLGKVVKITLHFGDLYCTRQTWSQQTAKFGLVIEPECRKDVHEYLIQCTQSPNVSIYVESTGWVPGQLTFVLPNRILGIDANVVNGIASTASGLMASSGTFSEWAQHVAAQAVEDPYRLFSIMLSFASVLLPLLEVEGGGFHFYGPTSCGKTTLLELNCTVWGRPKTGGNGFMLSWCTTANGIEAHATVRSNCGMCLDELGTYKGALDSTVYTLADGVGKATMTSQRSLRPSNSWDICFVSSGELSIKAKIESQSGTYRDGMGVRVMDVPMPELADDQIEQGRQSSDALKQACQQYYGTAGEQFIRKLLQVADSREQLSKMLKERHARNVEQLVAGLTSSQHQRAAKRFAIVELAGLLAVELGIVPATSDQVAASVRTVMDAWVNNPDNTSMATRGVESLQAYILRNWSKIADAKDPGAHRGETIGYRKDGAKEFLLLPDAFDQACGGVLPKVVLKELQRLGFLNTQSTNNDKRYKGRMNVNGQRIKGYLLSKALLGDDAPAPQSGARKQRPQRPNTVVPDDYDNMPEAHSDFPPDYFSEGPPYCEDSSGE